MEYSDIVLDHETPPALPAVHLTRSGIILKLYAAELIIFVVFALVQAFLEELLLITQIVAGLAGLGLMFIFTISPLGIFYIIKAFRKKEGSGTQRIWHLIGHVSVFVIVGLCTLVYVTSQ